MYDTATMLGVINATPRPKTALVDMFFSGRRVPVESAYVMLDWKKGRRAVAPYVNRRAAGKLVEQLDVSTKMYVPPSVRPAARIAGDDVLLQRTAGEVIGGSLTPQQREEQMRAERLDELDQLCSRREEQMTSEMLTTGVVTVLGDNVSDTITYGHTLNGAVGIAWSNVATAVPLTNFRTTQRAIIQRTGKNPNVVVLGATAASEMLNTAQVEAAKLAKNWVELEGRYNETPDGLIYHGSWRGIDIYEYTEWYYDEVSATEKPMVPDEMFVMGCDARKMLRNRFVYGAYYSMKDKQTYTGSRIPIMLDDEKANAEQIDMLMNPCPIPEDVDSWAFYTT